MLYKLKVNVINYIISVKRKDSFNKNLLILVIFLQSEKYTVKKTKKRGQGCIEELQHIYTAMITDRKFAVVATAALTYMIINVKYS